MVPREEQYRGNKASLQSCLEAVGGLYLVSPSPFMCRSPGSALCRAPARGGGEKSPLGRDKSSPWGSRQGPGSGIGGSWVFRHLCLWGSGWHPHLLPWSHKPFTTSPERALCLAGQPSPVFPGPLEAGIYLLAVGGDKVQQEKNHQTVIFPSRSH